MTGLVGTDLIYRTDTRFSTEAWEATVCYYAISLTYPMRYDRAFPVPRSMTVSLVALFTACSRCSRTLIYDKCSSVLRVLSCIERRVSSLVNTFHHSSWTSDWGLLAPKGWVARLIFASFSSRTMWTVCDTVIIHVYSPDEQPENLYPRAGRWLVGHLEAVPPSEWKRNPN